MRMMHPFQPQSLNRETSKKRSLNELIENLYRPKSKERKKMNDSKENKKPKRGKFSNKSFHII